MLIKKDEIVTFMHGLNNERDRPMIATRDFDLQVIADQLTEGMSGHDRQMEVYVLHERLEDMGLMRPVQQTLVRLIAEENSVVIELAKEDPRVTDKPTAQA